MAPGARCRGRDQNVSSITSIDTPGSVQADSITSTTSTAAGRKARSTSSAAETMSPPTSSGAATITGNDPFTSSSSQSTSSKTVDRIALTAGVAGTLVFLLLLIGVVITCIGGRRRNKHGRSQSHNYPGMRSHEGSESGHGILEDKYTSTEKRPKRSKADTKGRKKLAALPSFRLEVPVPAIPLPRLHITPPSRPTTMVETNPAPQDPDDPFTRPLDSLGNEQTCIDPFASNPELSPSLLRRDSFMQQISEPDAYATAFQVPVTAATISHGHMGDEYAYEDDPFGREDTQGAYGREHADSFDMSRTRH